MYRVTWLNEKDMQRVKKALEDVIGKGSYTQYLDLKTTPNAYEKLWNVENIEYDLGYDVPTLVERYKDLQQVVKAMIQEFNIKLITPDEKEGDLLSVKYPAMRKDDRYIIFAKKFKDVLEDLKDE